MEFLTPDMGGQPPVVLVHCAKCGHSKRGAWLAAVYVTERGPLWWGREAGGGARPTFAELRALKTEFPYIRNPAGGRWYCVFLDEDADRELTCWCSEPRHRQRVVHDRDEIARAIDAGHRGAEPFHAFI